MQKFPFFKKNDTRKFICLKKEREDGLKENQTLVSVGMNEYGLLNERRNE